VERGDDLGDGVLAGVVHLLGLVELALGELSRRPPTRPRARAAASPSRVPSTMVSRSNSASPAMMRKNSRPIGVEVSMPCSSTMKSTWRASNQANRVEQVPMVAASALQTGDDHLVAGLQACHQLVEVWAGGKFAGCLVDVDPVGVDPGARERVDCST
jgi:hypothetical protein